MTSAGAQSGQERLEGYSVYAAVLLMLVYILNFLDRQILAILAEEIKADLAISDAQLGFLFGTAFSVFYAVFGIPLARWADLGNRRKLIAVSIAIWSSMTALSGFATRFAQLAACRFAVGFGEAGASPAAYSMLYDYFPPRLRSIAIAIYSSGVYVGSGIGLFIGGAVLGWWNSSYPGGAGAPFDLKGWQAAFIVVSLPGIPLALWVLSLRDPIRGRYDGAVDPQTRSPTRETAFVLANLIPGLNLLIFRRMPNGPNIVRSNLVGAAAIAAVSAALTWITGDVAQWVALGIGGYALFSWSQGLAGRDPESYAAIFRNPRLMFAIGGFGVAMVMSFSFLFWTVPLFQRVFDAPPAATGMAFGIANAVGGSAGIMAGGFIADYFMRNVRGGKGYVLIASFLMSATAAAALLFAPNPELFFIANTAFLFSVAFGVGPGISFIADQVPAQARATATALALLCNSICGNAIGPYVIGKSSDLFVASGDTPASALQLAMLISGVAIPVAVFLVWRAVRLVRTELNPA